MEWSARVEELLQKNLSLGVELKNFKATSEERLRQVSLQLDQKLDASSNELKCLQEDSDGLLAKAMCFNEEVQVLEEAQKTQFSQVDEKVEKEGLAVAQMGGSLTHLRDALMIKNRILTGSSSLLQSLSLWITFTREKITMNSG